MTTVGTTHNLVATGRTNATWSFTEGDETMAIEDHASSDLSLSDEDAENIVGGLKKTTKKQTAPKTYHVDYIKAAGGAQGTIPAAQDPSMDPDDCGPES
jgi:hypothetical protein